MAVYDNTHSRVVAWLKIILPLSALGVLSTLFLVSRQIAPEASLPYSEVDVKELAREQRLSQPHYSGMTKDGAALTVTAEAARPDLTNPKRATGEVITALLDAPDGEKTRLTADRGEVDTGANSLILEGSVDIVSSSGMRLKSDRLNAALDQSMVESPGPVEGEAPMGHITADSMLMTGTGESHVVVFKGNVRLIYQPGH